MKKEFVLITGSAKGLGRELALVFAGNDYNIILQDRDRKSLREIEREIKKTGVDCKVVFGDLKSKKTLDDLYKISKKEKVSLLINNAGIHCPGLPLEKLDDKKIDDLLLVNLMAPVKLTQRIYSLFMELKRGSIINMNSLSGMENHKFRTVYCASKWGLRGFADTLRIEAKKNNIRILDVYPSRIKTRKEFKEGMEPGDVAKKIYKTFKNTKSDKLILDDRPKKNG